MTWISRGLRRSWCQSIGLFPLGGFPHRKFLWSRDRSRFVTCISHGLGRAIYIQEFVSGGPKNYGYATFKTYPLVLSKGTLLLLNRNSYYQKGTHQKGTLVLSKGTLILLNRNSYYQKGTPSRPTPMDTSNCIRKRNTCQIGTQRKSSCKTNQ